MRINIYTEELQPNENPKYEIVTVRYTSSKTGKLMNNYGLRIYLKSYRDLHYIPGRDDDRNAVTFWCGDNIDNVENLINELTDTLNTYVK